MPTTSAQRGKSPRGTPTHRRAVDAIPTTCTPPVQDENGQSAFTQTIEQMDLAGQRSALVGATLKEPAFFSECAKNPDVEARFDCVKTAMTPPEFSTCSPGEDLDYYT